MAPTIAPATMAHQNAMPPNCSGIAKIYPKGSAMHQKLIKEVIKVNLVSFNPRNAPNNDKRIASNIWKNAQINKNDVAN